MTSHPWDKLQPELIVLNQRLLLWQQQVKMELTRLLDPAKAATGEYSHEDQHNALRQAIAKAGDGPRADLNRAVDQICGLYLSGSASGRSSIRMFLGKQEFILRDLWGYMHRAAEQVRAGGGEQGLRFGLAIASIEDLRGEYDDTLTGLGDLYMAGTEAGINVNRIFCEIADLPNHSSDPENSIEDLLKNFEKTEYFLHEIQPRLARPMYRS